MGTRSTPCSSSSRSYTRAVLDRLVTRFIIGLAGVLSITAAFALGHWVGRNNVSSRLEEFSLLKEVEEHIADSSLRKVSHDELFDGALRGMVRAVDDPYSEYLDPEQHQLLRDSLASHYSGVGIALKPEGDQLKVVSVLSETPASKAGIVPGDIVVSVDGEAVAGLAVDEVARQIQGTPGSRVTLSVRRGQGSLEITMTREKIEREVVEGRMVRNRLGHIRITLFNVGVAEKVRELVRSLAEKGARGFILDLRGNPGGDFEEGVNVASAFLDGGRVVSRRDRGSAEVTYDATGGVETRLPLVVMVDEGTASASEIVAGAIQDRGRGIVVGSPTFGKNAVQTVIPLSDGSALKLTTASFYTPSGKSIGEKGITPDVSVIEKDLQLARAQQILGGLAGLDIDRAA